MKTLAQLKWIQMREEACLARQALVKEKWMLTRAALRLGCPPTTMRRLIEKHPKLSAEYAKRSPGRGRPPNERKSS